MNADITIAISRVFTWMDDLPDETRHHVVNWIARCRYAALCETQGYPINPSFTELGNQLNTILDDCYYIQDEQYQDDDDIPTVQAIANDMFDAFKKPEGIFKDGSLWYGYRQQDEHGNWWFTVGSEQEKGCYETQEEPERFPLFVMTQFAEGTAESSVKDYFARHANDDKACCTHARARIGYCPDCLKRIS